MSKFLIFIIYIGLILPCEAHIGERYYQHLWCSKWDGLEEYTLDDKTRVDCVTKNYAVEFDFAKKWAESLGQSLYYASKTKKKPAIILILENSKDWKYYNKLLPLCKKYHIQLWYMLSPFYK